MESPRNVTGDEPTVPGWTVYRAPEWWEARCNADPSLIVRHANPDRLKNACAAISQPPPGRRYMKQGLGPGGGFV